MYLKEMGCEGLDSIQIARESPQADSCEHSNEP